MNLNFLKLFDSTLVFCVLFSFLLQIIFIFVWRHKKYFGFNHNRSFHHIHLGDTPRFGGLAIIISYFCYAFFSGYGEDISIIKMLLLTLIPTILISLQEDLSLKTSPLIRLAALIFSAWIFNILYTGPFPALNSISFLSKLTTFPIFIFFFGIVGVANSMNLLDGVNGLCVFIAIATLSCLLFLAFKTSDIVLAKTIFTLLIFLIPFVFLNFPNGNIFLGDLGAYSIGLISGMLTIIFFGRHPDLSTYLALLILIYPITEVFFTIFRRQKDGAHIFKADKLHLHTQIFYFLRIQRDLKYIANPLTTIILSPLIVFPFLSTVLIYKKSMSILFAIILFILFYLYFFIIINKIKRNVSRKYRL